MLTVIINSFQSRGWSEITSAQKNPQPPQILSSCSLRSKIPSPGSSQCLSSCSKREACGRVKRGRPLRCGSLLNSWPRVIAYPSAPPSPRLQNGDHNPHIRRWHLTVQHRLPRFAPSPGRLHFLPWLLHLSPKGPLCFRTFPPSSQSELPQVKACCPFR